MKKLEIDGLLVDIIELLQKARPGSGPAPERAAARQAANVKIEALPKRWWTRATPALTDAFTALS